MLHIQRFYSHTDQIGILPAVEGEDWLAPGQSHFGEGFSLAASFSVGDQDDGCHCCYKLIPEGGQRGGLAALLLGEGR